MAETTEDYWRKEIKEAEKRIVHCEDKLADLRHSIRRLERDRELDQSLLEYQRQYGAAAPTREQLENQPRNSYWIPSCGWNVGE